MQISVRAYSNTSEHQVGTDLTKLNPPVNLLFELVGIGKYVLKLPRCSGTGICQFGGNVVSGFGSRYMECSLAADGHAPKFHRYW